jgi:hypothetical protein
MRTTFANSGWYVSLIVALKFELLDEELNYKLDKNEGDSTCSSVLILRLFLQMVSTHLVDM